MNANMIAKITTRLIPRAESTAFADKFHLSVGQREKSQTIVLVNYAFLCPPQVENLLLLLALARGPPLATELLGTVRVSRAGTPTATAPALMSTTTAA